MTDTAEAVKELTVTRYIAASPETVWHVMAERQEEWWCPKPWTVKIVAQDRRAGGRASMTIYGPDGEIMPNEGIYLAYEPGVRYVVTDAVSALDDFAPAGPFMIGFWEIAPEGDGTRYTARARHWTDEAMQQHKDMGFVEGWGLCADQLKQLCEAG